jgi:hypothetical protein
MAGLIEATKFSLCFPTAMKNIFVVPSPDLCKSVGLENNVSVGVFGVARALPGIC